MEEFTKDQKQYAYKRLDEREKEFISSDEMAELYQQIGATHGLLLDATGKMSNIVFLALIGLIKASEVKERLRRSLNLPDHQLDALINDLNEKIFVPYRKVVDGSAGGDTPDESEKGRLAETASALSGIEPTKDDILAEIENPTPTAHPITVDTGGPAAPREVLPEEKAEAARDFIAGKLTETISVPAQKANIPEPTLKNPEPDKPKPTYSVDPYREPLA